MNETPFRGDHKLGDLKNAFEAYECTNDLEHNPVQCQSVDLPIE
jgi:hypothetical protein